MRHRITCAGNAVRGQQTIERFGAGGHKLLASHGIGMEEKAGVMSTASSISHKA